jgi:dipeptidyl aminopeptidase/acylaminoacyl peptidase
MREFSSTATPGGVNPPRIEPYLSITSATSPVWLADGQLVYLSDASGVPQLWMTDPLSTSGTSPRPDRQLTTFTDRVGALMVDPTGDRLVFGMDTGGNERQQLWTVAPSETPRAVTADSTVIHSLGAFSSDGRQLAFASNARAQHVFDVWTVDLLDPAATPRPLLATDELLTPVAWSPDDETLLVQRANTNLDHDLLLVSLDGETVRPLTPHDGEASVSQASFDPRGEAVYLLTNQEREFTALARLDLATGRQTMLAAPEWDVEAFAVSPDGGWLGYVVNEDGSSRLTLREVATGAERPVAGLPVGVIGELHWSHDGSHLAWTLSGPQHPSGIWVCDLSGNARQVTGSDLAGLERPTPGVPETIRYPTFDGRQIPALWYRPDATPTPWPVVVDVHGGPESQRRVGFAPVTQFLLASGFATLAPNVRGSTGYGKTYCHLDDRDRRMDAVADVAATVDWLKRQPGVAADRIAIMGQSYGGFMVLAALTAYPDHWTAGVDIVGIANFVTFLEQTGPWRRRTRAAEYGDLERNGEMLRSISPIHRAEQITAPLLVIHGRNDPRVPLAEAEQIVTRLQRIGREVELVVFDDEGHGLVKRDNRISGYGAVAEFLARTAGDP